MTAAPDPGLRGHRARLRKRLLDGGPKAVAPHEILEMTLFQAQPRGDTKPLAKALLARFGDLAGVVAAPPEQLMAVEGCGEAAAAAVKSIEAAAVALLQARASEAPVLSSWDRTLDYLRGAMGAQSREQFRVLFLDRKNRLLGDEVVAEGTVDRTAVFPREIVRRALELGASALILAHNHPSGDPKPSAEDAAMTEKIVAACRAVDIAVHDHVVIARGGASSLRTLGLM
ncbi:MAG: DNA repair protein RadC [Pseudomonadota bacterium]